MRRFLVFPSVFARATATSRSVRSRKSLQQHPNTVFCNPRTVLELARSQAAILGKSEARRILHFPPSDGKGAEKGSAAYDTGSVVSVYAMLSAIVLQAKALATENRALVRKVT